MMFSKNILIQLIKSLSSVPKSQRDYNDDLSLGMMATTIEERKLVYI